MTMAYTLKNKRVLVTGAGRGIGRAIALICVEKGAKVAIVSRTLSELQETQSLADLNLTTTSSKMLLLECDLTKEQDVESTVLDIVSQWGGIDLLVNNAGAAQAKKGPLTDISSHDLKQLLDINVVAVHTVTSAVLRHTMLQSCHANSDAPKILNISSRAGKIGIANNSAYVASKFALEGMTSSLAKELKDTGITVNTLSPGMVDTRSFPKMEGRPGVRTAESIRDSFLTLLKAPSHITGHYLHADELDMVLASSKLKSPNDNNDTTIPNEALKPIDEPKFKF